MSFQYIDITPSGANDQDKTNDTIDQIATWLTGKPNITIISNIMNGSIRELTYKVGNSNHYVFIRGEQPTNGILIGIRNLANTGTLITITNYLTSPYIKFTGPTRQRIIYSNNLFVFKVSSYTGTVVSIIGFKWSDGNWGGCKLDGTSCFINANDLINGALQKIYQLYLNEDNKYVLVPARMYDSTSGRIANLYPLAVFGIAGGMTDHGLYKDISDQDFLYYQNLIWAGI
jgi:hypothetical protein